MDVAVPADFEEFVAAEYRQMVAVLVLYCGSRQAAEEAVQEALMRVAGSWREVRKKDVPAAWATRIAINYARSQHRRRSVEARALDRLVEPDGWSLEQEAVDRIAVRGALLALPHGQRAALILRYFVGLPLRHVALALGVPEGTAKSNVHRGLQRLRLELSPGDQEVDRHG